MYRVCVCVCVCVCVEYIGILQNTKGMGYIAM